MFAYQSLGQFFPLGWSTHRATVGVLEKHKNTACTKHQAAATAGGGGAPVRIGCRALSVLNAAFYSLLCLSLLLEARNRDRTLEGRESESSERASKQKRLPDRAQLAPRPIVWRHARVYGRYTPRPL